MSSEHDEATPAIELPRRLREFVDEQVADYGFASASEYLCALVRKEQRSRKVIDIVLPGGAKATKPADASTEDWVALKQMLLETDVHELRGSLASAAESLDRGEGRELDIEQWAAECRRRWMQDRRRVDD